MCSPIPAFFVVRYAWNMPAAIPKSILSWSQPKTSMTVASNNATKTLTKRHVKADQDVTMSP